MHYLAAAFGDFVEPGLDSWLFDAGEPETPTWAMISSPSLTGIRRQALL
jgi:hypothetical protein